MPFESGVEVVYASAVSGIAVMDLIVASDVAFTTVNLYIAALSPIVSVSVFAFDGVPFADDQYQPLACFVDNASQALV